MKLPLHTSDSGAWLYDADGRYLADFTYSKYTCEKIRKNAADIVAMSSEIDRLRAENARQRAWIDGVMAQDYRFFPLDNTTCIALITRPAPFEDK